MKINLSSSVALTTAMIVVTSSSAQAATITSDFSWFPNSATNSASTTLSDGTMVTFSSSAIPFQKFPTGTGFGVNIATFSGVDTFLTLSFDREISELRLSVSDLDGSGFEFFNNFSTFPTSVDGGLILIPPNTVSGVQNAVGNMFWDPLDANSVSFLLNRGCCNSFVGFREFEIDTPNISSTPESTPILGILSLGLLAINTSKKQT